MPEPTPWTPEAEQEAMERGKCGGKTRKGTVCMNPKGKRTGHLGYGRCGFHTGATRNGNKAAEMERVNTEIARLLEAERIETDDPIAGLAEAERRARTWVRVLERMTADLESLWAENHHGEQVPHVAFDLMGQWNDKSARTSKLAIDAGLEERQHALEQRQGEALTVVLRGFFGDVALALVAAGLPEEVVRRVWSTDLPVLFRKAIGEASGEAA